MLAKLWKKVLLAVCVIACIFNIMSKLVNRHSLKENLESANDGETVFSIFQKDEVVESESQPIIDGVIDQEMTNENTVSNNEVINNVEKESITVDITEVNEVEQQVSSEEVTTETEIIDEVETTTEDKKDGTFKFSDFTILF